MCWKSNLFPFILGMNLSSLHLKIEPDCLHTNCELYWSPYEHNPVLHFHELGAVPLRKPKFRKELSQEANESNSDVKQTQVHIKSSQNWTASTVPFNERFLYLFDGEVIDEVVVVFI